MSIRTTVTLDEDVLERVKYESRSRGTSFRDTLNDLLRAGLLSRTTSPRPPFKIKPVHMGYRAGLPYDSMEALLALGEGEGHR